MSGARRLESPTPMHLPVRLASYVSTEAGSEERRGAASKLPPIAVTRGTCLAPNPTGPAPDTRLEVTMTGALAFLKRIGAADCRAAPRARIA
jgi:hypothetical protein